MKVLGQLGIILGFAYAGHLLAHGLSIPLPSSVLGLLLLLGALRLRLVPEEWLGGTAHFLSVNMAFFFLPSAVGILENYHHINPVLGKLLFVCIASTLATFIATYAVVCALQGLRAKGKGKQ